MSDRRNSYADIGADLAEVLHGAARVQIALGRIGGFKVSTRGWSFNDLVSGIVALSSPGLDPGERQARCIGTLHDTMDAMTEIGASAVHYLHSLVQMAPKETPDD